ncbi:MAG: hypothetical protein E6I61_07190 [Chloroflexi bacterium]|nr:MAG: hypothetical protein E6J08_10360 [Chloroflexota bacterium]TME03952.1 MAG: hypothetical protein E6I71_08510 [Chloroflexota bacterium]TME41085.1 MAG: hypothetical protein E6I61_07190 [Chloroflexota bacterium]TME52154.1 MAG: hypothetical protein E6I53_07695 [Chloroflexota bacterium]
MPDTVVGLFRSRPESDAALRKLKEAGFGPDEVAVSTPHTGRRGHYGLKVLGGIVAGTVLGALVGAIATGMVPGVHPLVPGNLLATFLFAAVAGAATGGLAGALLSMAASGDRALFYEQEVESGRFLVSVSGPRLEEAQELLRAAGAMEAAPVEAPLDSGRPRPESG